MTGQPSDLNDEPREEFFRDQPYEYGQNPFNHLATASWTQKSVVTAKDDVTSEK